MDEILSDIGLSSCIPVFQEQKVGPKEVLELNNSDLDALGIINMGDKARLRNKCKTFHQLPESPTILKLRELSSRKPLYNRRNQTKRKISDTRRVHCGWMNKKKGNGVFCRVLGGKNLIDLEKKATLEEIKKAFLDMYFPEGENKVQGILLADIDYYIGNYAGKPLNSILKNGQAFSLENYYEEIKTYPIRLYLFTYPKNPKDDELCTSETTSEKIINEEPLPKLRLRKRNWRTVQKQSAHCQPICDDGSIESTACDKEMEEELQTLPDIPSMDEERKGCSEQHTSLPSNSGNPSDEELQSSGAEQHIVPEDSGTPTVIFNRKGELDDSNFKNENITAVDILKKLQENIKTNGKKNVINVDRNNIMDCKSSFRREKFKEDQPLFVRFSGEMGIDDGGPSREFMRLMIKSIAESSIFEGEDRKKMLLQNLLAEKDGDYETFGKIIAYCLVNGGPAPKYMSEFLYGLLAYGPELAEPTIEDIVDVDYQALVRKIEMSTDIASFFDAVDPIKPILDYIGGLSLAVNPQKKNELVHALCRHIVVTRIEKSLQQFTNGLSCLGVLDMIRRYPDAMREFFVYKSESETLLDSIEMDNMFNVVFSDEGSNRYINELKTQTFWRDYLGEIEDEPDKFKSLLKFITGLDSVPPLGFSPPLTLRFRHPEPGENFTLLATPYANTCTNTLSVPVTDTYRDFKLVMDNAVELGCLFTDH